MAIVKFTETVLSGTGKKGVLTPDSDGYYTFLVGGLNVYNSAGEYYAAEGCLELFNGSSTLMRRISSGALYAEVGHPGRQPGMSREEYAMRMMTIDRSNVCAHISEVWLDMNYGKEHPELKNPDLVAIFAKIRPSGEKKAALSDALESTKENPAFSVRGIYNNKMVGGKVVRILEEIITWDCVIEPGISIANKWSTPVLEELSDTTITKEMIDKIANDTMNNNIATEDDKAMIKNVAKLFNTSRTAPRLYSW